MFVIRTAAEAGARRGEVAALWVDKSTGASSRYEAVKLHDCRRPVTSRPSTAITWTSYTACSIVISVTYFVCCFLQSTINLTCSRGIFAYQCSKSL